MHYLGHVATLLSAIVATPLFAFDPTPPPGTGKWLAERAAEAKVWGDEMLGRWLGTGREAPVPQPEPWKPPRVQRPIPIPQEELVWRDNVRAGCLSFAALKNDYGNPDPDPDGVPDHVWAIVGKMSSSYPERAFDEGLGQARAALAARVRTQGSAAVNARLALYAIDLKSGLGDYGLCRQIAVALKS